MGRDKYIKRRLYKQILKENKRLEEEKKTLMADIRILVQDQFSSRKQFVESKWRKPSKNSGKRSNRERIVGTDQHKQSLPHRSKIPHQFWTLVSV
ncbi:hypothetical protein L0P88_21860 [Muricauda sp. SCSIO 64092]|uniref:hypothetical protein n=1 Tax=Allomuricauda sp. SCSIO 64092 TaxID=2908842 RepID=UPI001FF22FDE|nr:hypothetical protein [Muricauda sp. SCSIO 64092]UOY06555.1 hypothetical protein L0P88_21860 [Muricauda sp. SCSIO 64092]